MLESVALVGNDSISHDISVAPPRGAGRLRAAARKVLAKPKTAFQKVGSFFSKMFRRKAKPQPVRDVVEDGSDGNEVSTSANSLAGLSMCASLCACLSCCLTVLLLILVFYFFSHRHNLFT